MISYYPPLLNVLIIILRVNLQKINYCIIHSFACIFYRCSLVDCDILGEQVDLFRGELEIDYWETEGVGIIEKIFRLGMHGTIAVVLRREGTFGRVFHLLL